MNNCCGAEKATRHICPVNGKQYSEVSYSTLLHQLKHPWKHPVKQQKYYFCDDPECDVIYFSEDNSLIKQVELRTEVSIKSDSVESLVCYCFDISKQQAIEHPELKDFIIKQTRLKQCACNIRNPSGRCCLKDFPEQKVSQ